MKMRTQQAQQSHFEPQYFGYFLFKKPPNQQQKVQVHWKDQKGYIENLFEKHRWSEGEQK